MTYETILFDVTEGIATLTLNRPQERNAMTDTMFAELISALNGVSETDARVVVITGAGAGFCSGASLAGDDELPDLEISVRGGLNKLIDAAYGLDVPLITAINGAAAGAGCALALAGDIIVAGKSAFFLQAFANVGLIPDGGLSWVLPRLIGRVRAFRMMMLAERISAETAESWGMVTKVVDDDALMDETYNFARHLLAGPPLSYRMMRQAVKFGADRTLTETMELEAVNQGIAGRSEDFQEGVAAFQAKRKPEFKGK